MTTDDGSRPTPGGGERIRLTRRRLRIKRVDPGPSVIKPLGEDSRLSIAGMTRPSACPVCLTANGVTRGGDGRWLCSACDYNW